MKQNKENMREEHQNQKEQFNNVTNSVSVENQNQTYNIRKEALGPNGKR